MKNRLIYTLLLPFLVLLGLGTLMFLPELSLCGYELRPVNLLSDVGVSFEPKQPLLSEEPVVLDTIPVLKTDFVAEHKEGLTYIEDFSQQEGDTTYFVGRGMEHFYEMLGSVKQLGRPVRIAYFGDSFIEGDILTDQLRARLQTTFGGSGVGFVDMASPTAGFRQSVRATSRGWKQHCITDSVRFDRSRQGPAERFYEVKTSAWTTLSGNPRGQARHQDTCTVSCIYFRSPEGITLTAKINGEEAQSFHVMGSDEVQSLGVRGRIGKITWTAATDSIGSGDTFFGVTMDSEEGIILDNFSLRGSSGLTLRTIPDHTLEEFGRVRNYDLIVLHFGLNVASARQTNYSAYEQKMREVVKKMAHAFPKASILIVSVSDRGQKYDGQVTTMRGITQCVKYQQQLALHTGTAFWNLFEAMGGEGSMAVFADSIPHMANMDYTHLNFRGGRKLGDLLYDAIIDGKENYEKQKAYETEQ